MKKPNLIYYILFFLVSCAQASFGSDPLFFAPRDDARDRLFNDGWLFHRGDIEDGHLKNRQDIEWEPVTLPHDWSVDPIPAGEIKSLDQINPISGEWLYKDGDDDRYAEEGIDTREWSSISLPVVSEDFQPATYRWFRRVIELTPEQAKSGVIFDLGRIDDCDEFYVNGQKIGNSGVMPKNQPQGECIPAWGENRTYEVSAAILRPGKNLLAITVYNDKGPGGFRPSTAADLDNAEADNQLVGPFYESAIGGTHSGFTVGGTGWYRKHFSITDLDKNYTVRFGAVMMNSDVWINGNHLGFWPYGYTSFYYDLTPHLVKGDNVIAVRVRNEGVTSRWYPGSGIYRNVWLTTTNGTHVRPWGVWARTIEVDQNTAQLEVDVEIEGDYEGTKIEVLLLDDQKQVAAKTSSDARDQKTTLPLVVQNPQLWNLDDPKLYTARVILSKSGEVIDQFDQQTGIRMIRFSPDKGFQLNGKTINMNGACIHHDNGLIGARAPSRADIRKMEILKKEGYNAVRASHNPMSNAFYEACDRLGLLVMDEVFDVWNIHKTPQDYGGEVWMKGRARDVEHWLRRTRNHPSIVIRSLGNEIGNKRKDNIDAVIQDLKDLLEIAKPFDDTRPYTGGSATISSNTDFMGYYDVPGYNYREDLALKHHQQFPEWTMIGTESNPSEGSQYKTWQFVTENPWFTGCFVWSGFEYIGESWSGWVGLNGESAGWPSYAAACGLIDITGFPKGGQIFRRVMAGASPIEINVLQPLPEGQSYARKGWSWPNEFPYWGWHGYEGREVDVRVMTYAKEVRLLLNGEEIGVKKRNPNHLHVQFTLPYQPGKLVAEGISDGKVVHSTFLETPGKTAGLRIVSDRSQITSHNNDRAYISVEVIDAEGRLVMDGRHRVAVHISGEGEIEGAGSGYHKDIYSFGRPDRIETWRGRGILIVRPTGNEGKISIRAKSESLSSAQAEVGVTDLE